MEIGDGAAAGSRENIPLHGAKSSQSRRFALAQHRKNQRRYRHAVIVTIRIVVRKVALSGGQLVLKTRPT